MRHHCGIGCVGLQTIPTASPQSRSLPGRQQVVFCTLCRLLKTGPRSLGEWLCYPFHYTTVSESSSRFRGEKPCCTNLLNKRIPTYTSHHLPWKHDSTDLQSVSLWHCTQTHIGLTNIRVQIFDCSEAWGMVISSWPAFLAVVFRVEKTFPSFISLGWFKFRDREVWDRELILFYSSHGRACNGRILKGQDNVRIAQVERSENTLNQQKKKGKKKRRKCWFGEECD